MTYLRFSVSLPIIKSGAKSSDGKLAADAEPEASELQFINGADVAAMRLGPINSRLAKLFSCPDRGADRIPSPLPWLSCVCWELVQRRSSREVPNAISSDRGRLSACRCRPRGGPVAATGRLAWRGERPRLHAVFRAGSDQPREREAAETGLDVPHAGARRPARQDDRVHAAGDRGGDVRHHRVSPRRGPGRGDRQGRWQFDPLRDHPFRHQPASGGVNRGVAYWSDGTPGGARRIIHGTSDGRVFSLDAKDGKLDPKFAEAGVLNLRTGLDPKVAALSYGPTSAPALWRDTIIVGVSCGEGPGIAAPGDIRAFDVRTGQQVWRFQTVPDPGSSATRRGKAIPGRTAAARMPGAG